jgi:hypothetical protein
MTDHFAQGQISELIAFLYLVCWLFARRGRDTAAGVALGAACTLKLFPGALAILFAVQRRWRALVAAAAAYGTVAVIMTVRFGWRAWRQFFAQQAGIGDFWLASVRNGSLTGIVLRQFSPACEPAPIARWGLTLGTLLSLVMLAIGALLAWRAARGRGFDLAFALFSVMSFFANPWVWEHYNVFMLLPLGVALAGLSAARRRGLGDGALVAGATAVVASAALIMLPMWAKATLVGRIGVWSPAEHLALHLLEVAHWLPFVLTIVVLMALLAREPGRLRA